MSRVGRCIDNGPMEGFWGILKCEMYYLNHFDTYDELVTALEQFIHYYNQCWVWNVPVNRTGPQSTDKNGSWTVLF